MRLTVLGGSSVGTPALVLALRELAAGTEWQVMLHGRSEHKLEVVGMACRAAANGSGIKVDWRSSLFDSLSGADLVLNQIRVGGLEGRKFDEYFPRALGLVGEETLGAGGFSNAVRTIPTVIELSEAVRQLAPRCTIVNLTNPSSLVHQVLERHAGVKVISICDIPVTLATWLHKLLGLPSGQLEIDHLGTNHIGWTTSARDLNDQRRDRLSEALTRLDELPEFALDTDWVRALGVLPGPYLRYFYHRERYVGPASSQATRAAELLEIEAATVLAYANLPPDAGPAQVTRLLSKRRPHWYEEIVVPLLGALVSSSPRRLTLQITNGTRLRSLPPNAVLELPVLVSRSMFKPDPPAALPTDCTALLVQNAAYEALAVEAIVEKDRRKAVRALAVNPLVGTVEKAAAVVNAVWAQ